MKYKRIIWLILAFFIMNACTPSPSMTSTPTEVKIILPKTPPPSPPICGSIESLPTPVADSASLFAPISNADMILGADDAATTFIIYADFQDPASAAFASVLIQLREKYPNELRIIYRDFPMVTNPGHEKAGHAARAAHAAALQGKYWEMNTLFFEKQTIWSPLSGEEFEHWLAEETTELDIDSDQLAEDMQREEIVEKVRQAFVIGQETGIPFTPFLLINGKIHDGQTDFYTLDGIIALYALGKKQFTSCPPLVIDPTKEYLATLETEKGKIIIQFYPQQAPLAVNNFIFLAQNGWYENISFHRVLSDFFAETGDPSGTGQGNPGYFFENEISPNLSFNRPGVVAMKNVGAGTNGSQFFITYNAVPSYDGKYTIFGQVLSGMDVLQTLSTRDLQFGETLPPGDLLLSVTIEER